MGSIEQKTMILKNIYENQLLREELEEILKTTLKKYKKKNGYIEYERTNKKVRKALGKALTTISKKYQVEFSHLELYLSLDRDLFLNLEQTGQQLSTTELLLTEKNKNNINPLKCSISPYTYRWIYKNKQEDKIAYLRENRKLFPNSTQKYINKKENELKLTPALKKITNAFEARIFEKELEEIPNKNRIKIALKEFKSNKSKADKALSALHFYHIVHNKYENDAICWAMLEGLELDIFDFVERSITKAIESFQLGEFQNEIKIKKIAEQIAKDEILVKRLAAELEHYAENEAYYDVMNFLLWVTEGLKCNQDVINAIKRIMDNYDDLGPFSFQDASSNIKIAMVQDLKEQYILNNNKMSWLRQCAKEQNQN